MNQDARRNPVRAENDAINALRQTLHSQELSANRSLQLVNAGGAVALLAFLGQTWGTASELRMALVIAIALMVGGLCLAVWGGFQLPAYSEQGFRQDESTCATAKYSKTRRLYLWTVRLSFLAFVSAVFLLLVCVVIVSL